MNTLAAGLVWLSIFLSLECSTNVCSPQEQLEAARVVVTRANGSLAEEDIRAVLFKRKQFSAFNDKAVRANALLVIKRFKETGVYPNEYENYRIISLRAAVLGPGEHDHYRLCSYPATWSSNEWYTEPGWHHCFSRPEDVSQYQSHAIERQKVEEALERAARRSRIKFWKERINNEEASGC